MLKCLMCGWKYAADASDEDKLYCWCYPHMAAVPSLSEPQRSGNSHPAVSHLVHPNPEWQVKSEDESEDEGEPEPEPHVVKLPTTVRLSKLVRSLKQKQKRKQKAKKKKAKKAVCYCLYCMATVHTPWQP